MDDGLGIPPSDSDLAELKAQWVESVRPIIAMTPKRQRKSASEQLRKTMGCAGWPPEEAAVYRRGPVLVDSPGRHIVRYRSTSVAQPVPDTIR